MSAAPPPALSALREAARGCTNCPLFRHATQTVFGEGDPHAKLMLVGEQPGDREDLEGHPFVGPAGRLLDEALARAGIDRDAVYVTNAVKHFKWEPRGKRRLHKTPAQREILSRLTAVMSLLEGHADYVMDGVGPDVVPSVAEIREKFQKRRASGASRLDMVLRRLLGLDAKLRQYRDGERFVRAVVDEAGMAGFNRVWTSPNTLPTKAEIAKPAEWIARVRRRAE